MLSRVLAVLKIGLKKSSRMILSVVLIFMVIVVFAGAYINVIDQTLFGLLNDKWSKILTIIGSVVAVFLVFFKPLWDAVKGDGHLRNVIVTSVDKTDMKQMAKYMKSADSVLIYSGDFSYIYDHKPLTDVLTDLASAERLTLLSYKSRETVMKQSSASKGTRECIIDKLIASGKIHFGVPGHPKFSLVYRRGEEVVLYRHTSNGVDYVTIFKASNEMARELVNIFRMLADGIIMQSVAGSRS